MLHKHYLNNKQQLTLCRGFLITYMGSAAGTSPGRLVETDANYNIINEFPALTDIAGNLNVVEEPFNPHGLTVDWNKNIILTSDFVVPVSILKPSLGIQHDNTLRLWSIDSRTIISTITIPNVSVLTSPDCNPCL
jgi:selenium-binding protein 1